MKKRSLVFIIVSFLQDFRSTLLPRHRPAGSLIGTFFSLQLWVSFSMRTYCIGTSDWNVVMINRGSRGAVIPKWREIIFQRARALFLQ